MPNEKRAKLQLYVEDDPNKPAMTEGVELLAASNTFSQDEDSGGRAEHPFQYLRLELVDAGAGPYLVLSTRRWAIDLDDVDAFANMLQNFVSRNVLTQGVSVNSG